MSSVIGNVSKKLHYFSFNGLAESIRYILHYCGETFDDIRYERKDWPMKYKSVKEGVPYGQLPVYEEGNRSLNQSLAIARYIGAKHQLVPSDPWEQAVLDAVVFNVYDFWKVVLAFIKEQDPDKKQAAKKQVLEEHVDYFFSRFEKELLANNGFFGGKLTWADFVFVGILEASNLFLDVEIERNYPTVEALVNKIRNLPGVKNYIDTGK